MRFQKPKRKRRDVPFLSAFFCVESGCLVLFDRMDKKDIVFCKRNTNGLLNYTVNTFCRVKYQLEKDNVKQL